MFEIVAAIKTKYAATPAMALAGGLYLNHQPSNPLMPYGVYSVDADEAEENTGKGYTQRVRVTLEIYGKKAIDFQEAAEAFKDALFHQTLTLSAGTILMADLKSESIEDLEEDDDTQPQVFYSIEIEYLQSQTRP